LSYTIEATINKYDFLKGRLAIYIERITITHSLSQIYSSRNLSQVDSHMHKEMTIMTVTKMLFTIVEKQEPKCSQNKGMFKPMIDYSYNGIPF
jgi:hypothetical protein